MRVRLRYQRCHPERPRRTQSGHSFMSALCWKAASGLEAARMDVHSTNLLRSIGHPFLFIPRETRSPGNQRPGFDGLRGNTQDLRGGHERSGYAAFARARSGIAELLTSCGVYLKHKGSNLWLFSAGKYRFEGDPMLAPLCLPQTLERVSIGLVCP